MKLGDVFPFDGGLAHYSGQNETCDRYFHVRSIHNETGGDAPNANNNASFNGGRVTRLAWAKC
jgi:hypothetical protein